MSPDNLYAHAYRSTAGAGIIKNTVHQGQGQPESWAVKTPFSSKDLQPFEGQTNNVSFARLARLSFPEFEDLNRRMQIPGCFTEDIHGCCRIL